MRTASGIPRTHTIVALLQDHPGVLHRAVSLLRRRGVTIARPPVGPPERRGVGRMDAGGERGGGGGEAEQRETPGGGGEGG